MTDLFARTVVSPRTLWERNNLEDCPRSLRAEFERGHNFPPRGGYLLRAVPIVFEDDDDGAEPAG